MKKLLLSAAIILLYQAIYSQTNIVTVTAHIKGLQPGKWVYYREQGGKDKRDSVKTISDGFTFKIKIPPGEGDIYFFSIERSFDNPDSYATLYLDKGNVVINGDGPMFKDAVYTGAKPAEDFRSYTNLYVNYQRSKHVDSVYEAYKKLSNNNDSAGLVALQPSLNEIDSVRVVLEKQWVHQHPASPVSVVVLRDLHYNVNADEIEKEFSQLPSVAKNNFPAKDLMHFLQVNKLTGIGKTALNFTQPDTLGKAVSLKDFRGKYVLLDFWASWCGPCREENPNVIAAFNKYKDKNFTVLSVSLDNPGDKEKWLAAIHKDGMPWTHISDLKGWNNSAAKLYAIESIPANFLLDQQGKIIAKDLRGETLENKLAEVLQ